MTPATLDALASRYDAFLVDQFGVLLDGRGAYPWAPQALARLGATGKPVILLSNSGKRSGPNADRLVRLEFPRESFLLVLSSGEAAHRHLSHARLPPGLTVWLHARDDDRSAIEGLDLAEVARPGEAGLLLLAGSQADRMTLGDYETLLHPAARKRTPMLCTNPDIEMLTPDGLRPGAGRVARLYEDLGGPVEWIGKPYPLIYREAARLLPGIAPARVLCIGDSPEHDILGGQRAGHATALVRSDLNASMSDDALAALCRATGAEPDHVLTRFAFEGD